MIKIGLIGCGFMGTMHANCYSVLSGVKVTAVADLAVEKAEKTAKLSGAKIFKDAFDLIENADVDAIDICLPTYLHEKYAVLAMDKVKYLFIEKPVALTEHEAERLIDKQKQTGCEMQVGQVIRFWDEYAYLKKAYDGGKYGKVVNASFRRLSPRPLWGWNNWLLDGKLSGGAAQDLHIHDSDFMLYIFGSPKSFKTVTNKIGEKYSYINTVCEYENFVVSVEGTWDLPESFPFEMYYRVVFEKAVFELKAGELTVYENGGITKPKIEKYKAQAGFEKGNISDLGGYFNELQYFTETIKKKAKIEKATLDDGAKSLKFVLKEKGN